MDEGLEEAAAMRSSYDEDVGRLYISECTDNRADQKGPLLLIPKRRSLPKLLTHAQG
jgi:hypothetical protein